MGKLNTAIDMFKENPTQHIGTAGVVLVTKHLDPSDEFLREPQLDCDVICAEVLVLKRARALAVFITRMSEKQ
jgi:hypothetical protein